MELNSSPTFMKMRSCFNLFNKYPHQAPPHRLGHVLHPLWKSFMSSLLFASFCPGGYSGNSVSATGISGLSHEWPAAFLMKFSSTRCSERSLFRFYGTVAAKFCSSWRTRWECCFCDASNCTRTSLLVEEYAGAEHCSAANFGSSLVM